MIDISSHYQFSPELTFLLRAVKLGCQNSEFDSSDVKLKHLDWRKVLRLANFHGLSCWLNEYAKKFDDVPNEITTQLANIHRQQLLLMTFINQQKGFLVKKLEKAGVRFTLLKGAAIAGSLYQKRWHYRKMVDVDVLIDPQQLELAFSLLRELDYHDISPSPLGTREFEQICRTHQESVVIEHSLVHKSGHLTLDVHWKLRRNHLLPIKYDDLFKSSLIDADGVPRLIQDIEFIYLCVNGMDDGWRNLKSLVDILYYAGRVNDWTSIQETAKRLGLLHVINASLAICDFFFDTHYAPEKLSKKELTLLSFVQSSYANNDELPVVKGYLDNSSTFTFIKTSVSWWFSISSSAISKLTIIKGLLLPNEDDFKGVIIVTNRQLFGYVMKRIERLIKAYL